jgi:hypothetical protein
VARGVVFMRQGDERWGSRCPGPCPEHDKGITAPSACAVLQLGFGTMAARQRGHATRARCVGTPREHDSLDGGLEDGLDGGLIGGLGGCELGGGGLDDGRDHDGRDGRHDGGLGDDLTKVNSTWYSTAD